MLFVFCCCCLFVLMLFVHFLYCLLCFSFDWLFCLLVEWSFIIDDDDDNNNNNNNNSNNTNNNNNNNNNNSNNTNNNNNINNNNNNNNNSNNTNNNNNNNNNNWNSLSTNTLRVILIPWLPQASRWTFRAFQRSDWSGKCFDSICKRPSQHGFPTMKTWRKWRSFG